MKELTDIELIKIVVGSSFFGAIFGAGITSMVNWFLSKRNFKFKSYEEIVKRRFSSYEKITKINVFFNLKIRQEDESIIPYPFANGMEQIENFQMIIMEAFAESFWLNENMSDLFTELNVYIHNVISEATENDRPEPALIQIAIRDQMKIKDLVKRLNKQLREDLIKIHEVENFVHRTTSHKKTYPVISHKDN